VDSPGNKSIVLRSGVLIYAKLREANYGVWGWPQETINSNKKKMAIIEWILLETKLSFCEVEY
jgi:hypothetical protein